MKSDIEYFYNIKINQLEKNYNYYLFKYNLFEYIFVLYQRPKEDIKLLNNIVGKLKEKNIALHEFVFNKDYKLITTIDNENYVLLKINGSKEKILDIFDIISFQQSVLINNYDNKLYRNNWASLWSEKIDYFEYQIHEIGKGKDIVLNSFSYYVGLGENAISYVNNINNSIEKNYNLILSHKRLFYPNYSLNFYNPLSLVIDLQVRDIAEYIKSLFFNKQDAYKELEHFLKKIRLSIYEYHMLYARLLYPSYYFDVYEKIMNKTGTEKEIINIISLVSEYEVFLKESYFLISKYTNLEKIDWIMKAS